MAKSILNRYLIKAHGPTSQSRQAWRVKLEHSTVPVIISNHYVAKTWSIDNKLGHMMTNRLEIKTVNWEQT